MIYRLVGGTALLLGGLLHLTPANATDKPASATDKSANVADKSTHAVGQSPIRFDREIRPLLARNCFGCHGPDESHRQAGLRLDVEEAAKRVRKGRQAIKPGDPNQSEVWKRIISTDPEEVMPPADSERALTAEQKEKIRLWIEQGAPWGQHWAFEKPIRPALPATQTPTQHPIDAFIVARLEREKLTLSPPADRYTLARRVALDLTGLPPEPHLVQRFIDDPAPDAYERYVDELLRSPAFGERWARPWLDLARFADTKGYEKDLQRTIWPYRDWLIRALNADMPFDQFTREQLAGDLLPQPTIDQLLATAFHRNTMANDEGGTDDEEFRVAAVKDRVDTTMQVWMGVTFGCAKCHSHKYDPFSLKEYYQLYSFFNQTEDADRFDDAPKLPVPTLEQARKQAAIRVQLQALQEAQFAATVELKREAQQWETQLRPKLDQPDTGKNLPAEVLQALKVAEDQRSDAQKQAILRHVASFAEATSEIRQAIQARQAELKALQIPEVPILRELPPDKRRPNRLHIRGNFLDSGEAVQPDTPKIFPPFPKDAPRNRLGLAQWLTHPDNPLTARVAVNRVWALLFGTGLVESQEDFGSQGQPPSHPELLDWLAVEYRDNGWSLKKLLKTIVTSQTYRQSSKLTPELASKDPRNRLLARGPRFRMEAEMIRDVSLAVSGLLSRKMYGPSVMPPQPDGLWRSAYSGAKWETATNEDRYRRGIYTFIKRTTPYPAMATFDAPSRELCTIRRINTNTPLQALVTLNDTAFVEMAQALARRMLLEGGKTTEERIAHGLRLALVRPAQPEEVTILAELFAERQAHFAKHPQEAKLFAGTTTPTTTAPTTLPSSDADRAALTAVANVILNLDEFLTRN